MATFGSTLGLLLLYMYGLCVYNVQCIPVDEFFPFDAVDEGSSSVPNTVDGIRAFNLNQFYYFYDDIQLGLVVSANVLT